MTARSAITTAQNGRCWRRNVGPDREERAASVLSGNRNFEGRVHPDVRANYLASPPLVVAYAIAGRVDIDLTTEPLGTGSDGAPVYLRDIWPSQRDVQEAVERAVLSETFRAAYRDVYTGDEAWRALPVPEGDRYAWEAASTYEIGRASCRERV